MQERGPAAYIAEFIGTFGLVFAITMSVVLFVPAPVTQPGVGAYQPFQDFAVVGLVHTFVLFALLSAVYALSRWAAGLLSGVLAERLGFATYFFVTFLMGLPAYLLLPRVRNAGVSE